MVYNFSQHATCSPEIQSQYDRHAKIIALENPQIAEL